MKPMMSKKGLKPLPAFNSEGLDAVHLCLC